MNSPRSAEYFARLAARRKALGSKAADFFSENQAFVWEVGCGHGHFLTAYATAHPEKICIGVDIVRERIARANRKRDRAKIIRLHFVLAEAHEFLDALPPEVKLSAIFILFPDPWPKRRHHKNRLLQSGFLDQVVKRAGEETRLYFRTDYEPYFTEVAAVISAHAEWRRVDDTWPFELETVFQARALSYHSLIAAPKLS